MRAKDHARVWAYTRDKLKDVAGACKERDTYVSLIAASELAYHAACAYRQVAKEQEEQDGH